MANIIRVSKTVHRNQHRLKLLFDRDDQLIRQVRRSEVLNHKPTDIDSQRNCIIIRDAKGNKDRITLLSQKAQLLLRKYKIKFVRRSGFMKG